MKITARDFIQIWQNFIEELQKKKKDQLEEAYNSNEEWRSLILGKKSPEDKKAPLADFMRKHNYRFSRYKKDYMGKDLVLALQDNFSQVFALKSEDGKKKDVVAKDGFFPRAIDLILEHKSDINQCYEEMLNMVNTKARLKVLITYNWETDGDKAYDYAKNVIGENFHKIIEQANELFPENLETEYLLMVGYKEDGKVAWNYYIYQIRTQIFYTKFRPI